jgi:uncharacterized repeat protein (TIGR03803 family)
MSTSLSFRIRAVLLGFVLCTLVRWVSAQTYTDIHDFNESDGCCANIPSLMAQGQDGNIYGTTSSGGKVGYGVIFQMSPSGAYQVLHNFDLTHGGYPQGGLSLGVDGNFYGTTVQGGAGYGTIFKVTPSGGTSLLYSFANTTDGGYPKAPPTQALDGNLYGLTGNGTVQVLYKLTTAGVFSVVLTAPSQSYSPMILGTDGNLYGMTLYGGTSNRGTVFQFSPVSKKLKIIHSFDVTNGGSPQGPLVQGTDGLLYGICTWGGSASGGVVFRLSTGGGGYTVLYNFDTNNPINGTGPQAGLALGSDGYLYGVTTSGGTKGLGVLFRISTKGVGYAVLHNFDTPTGDTPLSTPLLHTNGKIYGLAFHGGAKTAYGAIYSLDNGMPPFVAQYLHYSGKVGATVGLLGQGFSNATGVKFGAGPGAFVAASDTYMTVTVSTGAMTGKVTVLEPGGNLTTPQTYKVLPTASSFSPASGPIGTKITINGVSLKQTTAVKIGTIKATGVTIVSDTQVTAIVAARSVTGKVSLTTSGGSATAPGTFTVQ